MALSGAPGLGDHVLPRLWAHRPESRWARLDGHVEHGLDVLLAGLAPGGGGGDADP